MDNLEKIVEPLRGLPGRVTKLEEQIVQLRTEMRGEFSAIRRDMVTKQDAARFATKDDLKRFATKEDLKRFATKEDLTGLTFATKEDLADLKDKMLVLHEAVIERLKVLGDALPRREGPEKETVTGAACRTEVRPSDRLRALPSEPRRT